VAITFNGVTRLITLETGITSYEVADIYSAWKAWVLVGDNAKYLEAFRVSGGDPLGGGAFAASNFFLQNQLGWRIKPPEQNINITLIGNLYPEDPNNPWRQPTVGNYQTSINTDLSVNLVQVDTGGGGGGGGATPSQVADAVWGRAPDASDLTTLGGVLSALGVLGVNKTVTDPVTGKFTVYDDDGVTVLFEADLWENAGGSQRYRGQGAERRDRLV
jgi:hypothetical protein